ncbi:MAG TPA: Uma2 family endonuclease [Candidatus Eremiobacteraceae bacterium]|nr:Uma2 family endonuclease [Candidatus Eremiobacteraceae bacterium]
MREIKLPEAKPALEWVNGRALQKVSPQRKHALAQARFASALLSWAFESGSGRVGTEWDFRIQPPGEERRPLVPDVAYLSYERVPYEADVEADIPRVAPDVVVEVISPGDRWRDIDEKVRVYLAAGTTVVFLVDTDERTVTACERTSRAAFGGTSILRHPALPQFAMPVNFLFEEPKPKTR